MQCMREVICAHVYMYHCMYTCMHVLMYVYNYINFVYMYVVQWYDSRDWCIDSAVLFSFHLLLRGGVVDLLLISSHL